MNVWRYIPHPHKPFRWGPVDGFKCRRCGSRSARVQRKGRKK